MNEYSLAFSISFFSSLLFVPLLFLFPLPSLGPYFGWVLAMGGLLNVVATIFYFRALKESELSSSMPLIAFTPLFLLVTSPLILGEFPSSAGFLGIVLVVAGSLVLHWNEKFKGTTDPVRGLFFDKGARYMVLSAFIWSITSNLDKIGVQNSSPLAWAAGMEWFMTIGLFASVLLFSRKRFFVKENWKIIVPSAVVGVATSVIFLTAISLTLVAYVIAIKRLSGVFSVLLGHFFLKEHDFKDRLTGAVIMAIGAALILVS